MRAPSLGASLSISVDLTESHDLSNRSADSPRRAAERLVELFAAAGVAATWAAVDPASSDIIARATRASDRHEAALLVDPHWLAGEKGRSRLISELMVRAAHARHAGLPISTLALTAPLDDPPLDLLSKYGIRAIRAAAAGRIAGPTSGKSGSAVGPTPLRFGVWQIPCDARLSGGSALAEWFAAVRIRRAIDRRIRGGAPFHLAIDVGQLAIRSSVERLGNLQRILQHVARGEREGLLRVETISQMIARLSAPAGQRSAQSILRAA